MHGILQNGALLMDQQTSLTATHQGRRNLLILLFAAFVLTGVATVIIGPMLPVFIRKWSLDDGQAGLFFTVQFMSAMAGVGLSSILSSWRGYRPALFLGYALIATGLAALNTESHATALLATASFGGGYGLVIPGSNLLVAEAGGRRSASLLSLLNFMWGVGAVACSPLILLALKRNQLPALLTGLAIIGGGMALSLLFAPITEENHASSGKTGPGGKASTGFAVTMALAALFFIYVGMETSIGGWSAELAKRLANGATGMTTLAPMFFYGGLMSGRAFAPLVLLRVHERRLALGALGLAAFGTALAIATSALTVAIAGVLLAGLGCASIYPIYVAWLSKWYGGRAKRVGGIMFALASLGGSVVPWFVGFVSKHSGSLRVGLLVPFASAVTMIGMILLLRQRTKA